MSNGRNLIAVPHRRYLYSLDLILCRHVRCPFHKKHIYYRRWCLRRNRAVHKLHSCPGMVPGKFQNKNCRKGKGLFYHNLADRMSGYILPGGSARHCRGHNRHCFPVGCEHRVRYHRHCCRQTHCLNRPRCRLRSRSPRVG